VFDITSVLKGAPGNGQEQIVYLDLDLLDPDERNFYSLEGLDDLAANIELLGLQQPLRVRPGEGGHYTIVSGHRRRAACMLIRDGGSEMFAGGVPCIVEYGEASEAMQELRLIYANAATRVMGPAEISRQAERVEALLYELKEKEGIEFPGRMRDHVAQACQVSKSKIARLHAIRKNLEPRLLEYFDRGELAEETAYQLQRLRDDFQTGVAEQLLSGKRKNMPKAEVVEAVVRNMDGYLKPFPCRDEQGSNCRHVHDRIVWSIFSAFEWSICTPGKCCLTCYHKSTCTGACAACKDARRPEQQAAKREAERQKAEEAARQEKLRAARVTEISRLLPLIDAKRLGDDAELPKLQRWAAKGPEVETVRKMAGGEFGDAHFYDAHWLPTSVEDLSVWADFFDCSLDYLAGRSETPQPVSGSGTAGGWGRGKPPKPGEYLAVLGVGQEETPQTSFYRVIQWTKSEGWCQCKSHAPIKETIFRWLQLPEV